MNRTMMISAASLLGVGCASADVEALRRHEHVRPLALERLPDDFETTERLRVVERDGTHHVYPEGTHLVRLDDGIALWRTDGQLAAFELDALERLELVSQSTSASRRRNNEGVVTGIVVGLAVAATLSAVTAAAFADSLDGIGSGLADLSGFAVGR